MRWRGVVPTSSISFVLRHFCTDAIRFDGAVSGSIKYGFRGALPAFLRLKFVSFTCTSDADGVGTWQAASGGVSGTGVADYLPLWSDASTLTSSSLYETGGSIGIGTTAPSDELHVVGNIRCNEIWLDGGNYKIVRNGIGPIQIGDGLNDVVYLNGDVGIGTATPTSKLQVVGIPGYATDGDAGTGGLTAGALYQTSGHATLPNGILMVKQ